MPPVTNKTKPHKAKEWKMGPMAKRIIQPIIRYPMVETTLKRSAKMDLKTIPETAMAQTTPNKVHPNAP